jgi:hypothetical protein
MESDITGSPYRSSPSVALTELTTKLFKNRVLPFDERAQIACAPRVQQ